MRRLYASSCSEILTPVEEREEEGLRGDEAMVIMLDPATAAWGS
jgi:hypothetical protein